MGWPSFSVERGFQATDSVVTVQSTNNIGIPCYSGGSRAKEHMETLAEVIGRREMASWTPIAAHNGAFFPLFVLGPPVAKAIAKDGWSKDDIKDYLYENVKTPAGLAEKLAVQVGLTEFSFCKAAAAGTISQDFCQSDDPGRLVPVFLRRECIEIVVSGDPGRNQSRGYVQNQKQGAPISRKIALPAKWAGLLARSG